MLKIKKVYIFDDIIKKEEQEIIKNKFFGKNFPWYFIKDISKTHNNTQTRPGFFHYFINEEKINSFDVDIINHIIENSCKKIKFKHTKILQARAFLQLPLSKKNIDLDTPHLDRKIPHLVFLYYVCDSDGDTVIYNYRYKKENDIPNFKNLKELKRIKPKQGRVVVFDGLYWHTAQQPENNTRCIINCNLI